MTAAPRCRVSMVARMGVAGGIAVLLLVVSALGVLPPGYEDELYCPASHCLRPAADIPAGWSGPATSFWECASLYKPTQRPRAWGSQLGEEVRETLLADGYHMAECYKTADQRGANAAGLEVEVGIPEVGVDPVAEIRAAAETLPEELRSKLTEVLGHGEKPEAGLPEAQPPKLMESNSGLLYLGLFAISALALFYNFGFGKQSQQAQATPDQKASLEAARKLRLDKLEKETEDIRQTDEWKARQQAAKDEVDGKSIKPEHRRAAAEMGRCGGKSDQTMRGGLR